MLAALNHSETRGDGRLKVVHIAPTVFGAGGLLGGGERYPLELARALAEQVPCELVTFGARPGRWHTPAGLMVRVLPARRYWRGHIAHPLSFALVAALRDADIVHAHHFRSAASLLAALAARWRGQQTAVTDHGLAGSDWGGRRHALFDLYLLVSAYSARELRAPPARTTVIYGGADPARFAPDPAEPREGVLFVGRLTPHKGVDRLLQALPRGARLTIAGSVGHDPRPPERDYPALLRRLAAGRDVRFVVPAPEPVLPALYRQARVFVLPSVHRTVYGRTVRVAELLGLSVLEAMASGTPVVASRLGGIPEIVDDGVTGFLVPPGDVEALRERLAYLLERPRLAAAMGAAARERVLDRFTWRACAARCWHAYTAAPAACLTP
ncbi:MAG: glycosyltransferase family 4 protein [Chloroflexi bacterium]|nr:glycosyltransferase family 4 protein [Chloroflexota bacterium]